MATLLPFKKMAKKHFCFLLKIHALRIRWTETVALLVMGNLSSTAVFMSFSNPKSIFITLPHYKL